MKIFRFALPGTLAFLLLSASPGYCFDDIPLSSLPKTVVQAIEKRFPNAKLLSAEKERDNGKVHYEVKIQNGDKKQEVNVRPNGTIYKIEDEDDD